jgi:hypothetical protein
MLTVLEALKSINGYPIPLSQFTTTAEKVGLNLYDEATLDVLNSDKFKLAEAEILTYLSNAPEISQGGQTYKFSDADKTNFINRASALREDVNGDSDTADQSGGYVGDML